MFSRACGARWKQVVVWQNALRAFCHTTTCFHYAAALDCPVRRRCAAATFLCSRLRRSLTECEVWPRCEAPGPHLTLHSLRGGAARNVRREGAKPQTHLKTCRGANLNMKRDEAGEPVEGIW